MGVVAMSNGGGSKSWLARRRPGIALAAIGAMFVGISLALAGVGGAHADGPVTNSATSDLKGAEDNFSNVTVSSNTVMTCTDNAVGTVSGSITFTISNATSPAGAYFLLFLQPNNGSDVDASVANAYQVQVDVGNLAPGTYTRNFSF